MQAPSIKGDIQNRVHRTLTTFDENDCAIVVDICNYKTAWALRKLTEEFISVKLICDLDIFE